MNKFIPPQLHSALQKKLGRILLALIGLILLLALLSWLLLPGYVKQLAEQQVEQQLGRKLSIASVSFSPFGLALRAEDIRLYEADGSSVAAQIGYADINLSMSSLMYRALVLDELRLHQPQVHIQRLSAGQPARYNFSDMLDKLAQSPKSDTPLSFSIANIRIDDASLSFDDQVLHEHNEITHLNLGLPFVSNFPREIQAFVEPSLTAYINGAGFALNARSRPFAADKETRLALDLEKLDIRPLLAYLPVALPVQVASAQLSSKLDLIFKQSKQPEIVLAGSVDLARVELNDRQSRHLLKFDHLHVGINKLNVLNGTVDFGSVELSEPQAWLAIDAQQRLNWQQALSPASPQRPQRSQQAQAQPEASAGSVPKTAMPAKPPAEQVSSLPVITVQQLKIRKGQLNWQDQFFAKPEQQLNITDIELQLNQLSTVAKAAAASLRLDLRPVDAASLHLEGALQLAPLGFDGKLNLQQLPLASLQAYLKPYLNAALAGQLSSEAQLALHDGQWQIKDGKLALNDISLQPQARNTGSLAFKNLNLDQINIDSASASLQAGSLQLDGLVADLQRDGQGQLNLLSWLNSPAPVPAAASAARPAAGKPDKAAWQLGLDVLKLNASQLRFADQSVSPAVKVSASNLQLQLDHLDSQFSRTLGFSLQTQLNRSGRLQLQGSLAPALKQLQLNLNAQNLPVAGLYPYFSSALNVQINKGTASTKGRLTVRDPLLAQRQISFDGNLSLNDFDVVQNQVDEDFLNWKNIALDGILLQYGGRQNLLQVGQLSLKQFYARAVLSEQGKLNLQQILAKPASTTVANTGPAANAAEPASQPAAAARPESPASQAAPMVIRIAQTRVADGNINFTDHFIKPNYHANLTSISGSIGMLASDQQQPASIELNGKVDDDAPLLISGAMNPLSNPVFLDLKGSANGIELSRLTPYATKYAGYSIEKGKLSMQVGYRIEAGQLKADNSLTLDQLTFGDKVDSPTATRLPVLLAVALLRDNDGRIAINLPISGSLSDPQFSVGGIIVKVFVNLITKALTSPFALLGSMFGSGEELSFVSFPAGSAELQPAASTKLEHLVHALKQRQGLKLDITGRADPQSDSEGLKAALLERQLKQAKWNDSSRANRPQNAAQLSLSAAERERYIQQLYKQGQFAKAKNMLGLSKTLPASEAEQILLKNLQVSDEDLRMLAQKRADMVRDYLENTGQLGRERLFLIAPKVIHEDAAGDSQPGRVDFALK